MYSALIFAWCFILALVLLILVSTQEIAPFIAWLTLPIGLGIGGVIFVPALARALRWEWIPWWGNLFLAFAWLIYGWVPKKAFDVYFWKLTNFGIGISLAEQEEYEQAIAKIEQYQVSKNDAEFSFTYYLTLGGLYKAIEKWGKAIDAYQKALTFKSENHSARIGLAESYRQNKQFNEALELLRELRISNPKDTESIGMMARLYINLEMYDDADELLKEAVTLKPMEAVFHKMRAEIYLGKGLYEDAMHSAKKALQLNPSQEIEADAREIVAELESEEQLQ